MKQKRNYTVTVEHEYGPWEVYNIEATSKAEARKKAKDIYAKTYFKRSLISTYFD